MDIFERVYYMRALVGIVAGIVAGILIPFDVSNPPQDQNVSILTAVGIAILFYFVSIGAAKGLAPNVPRDKRRKIATEGIIPFIFLLMVFLIIVYTALHQKELSELIQKSKL